MSRFTTYISKSLVFGAALMGWMFGASCDASFAQSAAASSPPPVALSGPEQRVALVIGNAHYQNAPVLANPDDDAQSMAQFLNSAGFEVVAATDLTQNDMIRVVQDFSAKIAQRGPNTVAMIYYAGHGVQLAGENYLIPVDANVSTPADLTSNSLRLVDLMATLEAIPSRMRIVILDACRNNPFPTINDAGRGLAIVDAPTGSIVGYSTAPGTEALDGSGNHSPYAEAFLKIAREPDLPIEQLFKRVRLEVNHTTSGQQTPWESSSLTSDFYFFGDTAVASTRAPNQGRITQVAANLPGRSVRQAYDYVLAQNAPEYYQEFIEMFPQDPLCDRIRMLLGNLVMATAWHKAVITNTPLAYKAFADSYGSSPYAQAALKLQLQPKVLPVAQPAKLIVTQQLASTLKLGNTLQPNPVNTLHGGIVTSLPASNGTSGPLVHSPGTVLTKPLDPQAPGSKIVTLPPQATVPANTTTGTPAPGNTGVVGNVVHLPVATKTDTPVVQQQIPGKVITLPQTTTTQGGKVVSVPVRPAGGVDVRKETAPTRVDLPATRPVIRETVPLKVSTPPSNGVVRPQGGSLTRTSGGTPAINSYAQSTAGRGGLTRW